MSYGFLKISASLAARLITRSDDGYVAVTAPRDELINHKRDYFLERVSNCGTEGRDSELKWPLMANFVRNGQDAIIARAITTIGGSQ